MDKQDKPPTAQNYVRRKNFKRQRAAGRHDKPQKIDKRVANLGFFGQVPSAPSLYDLQRENRRKTRKHFGKNPQRRYSRGSQANHNNNPGRRQPYYPGGPTPRPAAPLPATRFLDAGNPLITPKLPAEAAAADGAGGDKLEAEGLIGLDFYGTNEGMDFLNDLTDSSDGESDGSDDEMHGDHDIHAVMHGTAADGAVPLEVRQRLAERDAYIAELEDENLKLRERLDLMRQELMRLRAGGGAMEEGGDDATEMVGPFLVDGRGGVGAGEPEASAA